MPVKKVKSQKSKVKTETKAIAPKTRTNALSVPVYSLAGRESGTLNLPKEIFGQKVNKKLLTQALRVYSTNKKHLTGSTKTRGEVEGSTVKIYRQKGTGRARHGAIRAPIFVGGGIAFGPKPRKVRLSLPAAMKKAALLSALSSKVVDKNIIGFSGAEKASGKTKEIADLMKKLKIKSGLVIAGEKNENLDRAIRNINGIKMLPANAVNVYEVIKHNFVIITKEALEKMKI